MRQIQDAKQSVSQALPAAGATNTSASMDFTQGGEAPETVELEISVPALPSLADAKNATFTVEESDDDTTFAAAPWGPTVTLTGAGGAGAAAKSQRFRAPASAKRYIRLSQTVDAAGGDNTAQSGTLRMYF